LILPDFIAPRCRRSQGKPEDFKLEFVIYATSSQPRAKPPVTPGHVQKSTGVVVLSPRTKYVHRSNLAP